MNRAEGRPACRGRSVMRGLTRLRAVFVLFLIPVLWAPAWAAGDAPDTPFVKYSVSGQVLTIVSAVTPYDPRPHLKDVFLDWFKRGFETVLAGKPPLLIEWDFTPEGRAGRSGYDLGISEAEKLLKNGKTSGQMPRTTRIPAE